MKVKMEGKSDLDPEVFGLKPPPDQDKLIKKELAKSVQPFRRR